MHIFHRLSRSSTQIYEMVRNYVALTHIPIEQKINVELTWLSLPIEFSYRSFNSGTKSVIILANARGFSPLSSCINISNVKKNELCIILLESITYLCRFNCIHRIHCALSSKACDIRKNEIRYARIFHHFHFHALKLIVLAILLLNTLSIIHESVFFNRIKIFFNLQPIDTHQAACFVCHISFFFLSCILFKPFEHERATEQTRKK